MRYVVIVVSGSAYMFWDSFYHGGAHTNAVMAEIARVASLIF